MSLEIYYLGAFEMTVKITGKSRASHILLLKKKLNCRLNIRLALLLLSIIIGTAKIFAVARNSLFITILERSTSILFSVHLLSLFKNWFYMTEKTANSSRMMLNKLTKLTKILQQKIWMQQVFASFRYGYGQYQDVFSIWKTSGGQYRLWHMRHAIACAHPCTRLKH